MSGQSPKKRWRPTTNRQRVEDYYGVHDTGMSARPAPTPPPGGPTVPGGPTPPRPPGPPPQGQPPQGQAPQGQAPHGLPPQAPRPPRVIPPPEVQVAAKEAARAAAGAPPAPPGAAGAPPGAADAPSDPLAGVAAPSFPQAGTPAPEAPRTKPDPLTDPLTSETFQGVQPVPDTFDAGVAGRFGYSSSTGPQADTSATSFDGGFDQFAPPRFEPRAEGRTEDLWADAPSSAPDGTETFEATFAEHPEPVTETLDEPDETYIDVEVVDVEVYTPVAEEPAPDEAAVTDEAAVSEDTVPEETAPEETSAQEPAEEAPAEEPPPLPEPLAIDPFPYTQIDETYVDAETLQSLRSPHKGKDPGDMTEFTESLNEAMNIDGALGVALVDAQSGMALATAGNPADFDLEVAAAGNSALVQAMSRTLGDLDLDDRIEDILITLGSQYQIVRPINQGTDDLFLYLVLDRSRANLAMARFRLTRLAEQIEI